MSKVPDAQVKIGAFEVDRDHDARTDCPDCDDYVCFRHYTPGEGIER